MLARKACLGFISVTPLNIIALISQMEKLRLRERKYVLPTPSSAACAANKKLKDVIASLSLQRPKPESGPVQNSM